MAKTTPKTGQSLASIPRPKTAAVVGKHAEIIEAAVAQAGLRIVKDNPQMVVTFGGDGTILKAERLFPGVPKLCARYSAVCIKCGVGVVGQKPNPANTHVNLIASHNALKHDLKALAASKSVHLRLEDKLQVEVLRQGKKVFSATALNEAQVHNLNPLHAVRGEVRAGAKTQAFIGDGVIVATPFGSTGYFHSISRRTFDKGIGIAFNNPVRPIRPMLMARPTSGNSVEIRMERHNGVLLYDNSPDSFALEAGDVVKAAIAKQKARFVVVS